MFIKDNEMMGIWQFNNKKKSISSFKGKQERILEKKTMQQFAIKCVFFAYNNNCSE